MNGTKFMIISSRKLKFATVNNISSWTVEHLSKILNTSIKLNGQGGIDIFIILM